MTSNHIEILKSELELRRARNPAYSLRSFSRDLGLVPSALSDLLNGKKGISPDRAKQLAQKIGLDDEEEEVFILSARATHGRGPAERAKAAKELKVLKRSHRMVEEELAATTNWYYQALLELTELESCEHTVEWFAGRLGLSEKGTRAALNRLLDLGWLKMEDGKFSATSVSSESSVDIPSKAIQRLHGQALDQAARALVEQTVEEREFITTSFSFDSSQLKEAKQAIRKFQRDFSERFYSASVVKDSVYQVSVQFIRLDKRGKSK